MAEITAKDVNDLRKSTGLGLMECKSLLQESGGDMKKAITLAKERGVKNAEKRAGRVANAGRIETYIHHDGKSGAMVEVNCETDFVARNDEFKQLARELALQVVAARPLCVNIEDLNPDAVAEQKRIFLTQVADKPEMVREKITEGKLKAWYAEVVLLEQPFVKDSAKSIREMILGVNARTGENISVARFARFVLGEQTSPDA